MIPAISAMGGNCRVAFNINGFAADSVKIMVVNFLDPTEVPNKCAPVINGKAEFSIQSDGTNLIVADFLGNGHRLRPNVRVVAIPDCPLTVEVSQSDFTIGGASEYYSIAHAQNAIGSKSAAVPDSAYCMRVKSYIIEHPDDVGSAFVACDLGADILNVDSLIGENAKKLLHGYYDYFYDKYEAPVIAARNAERTASGMTAPDFTLTDIDGNAFSLSSLRGKTVLLDFWGSWCIPCLKSLPKLKEQYAHYKDRGLEIVSIACNDTDEAWRSAVARNGINWINLLNGGKDGCDVSQLYGVSAYPTMFIIDKDGVISAKTTGESDEFFSTLRYSLE